MADTKTTGLTELAESPADADLLMVVDVSDTAMAASGTNKNVTRANLFDGVGEPVIVIETGDFTVDPATHVDGCRVVVASAAYPNTRDIILPALASQPSVGYRITIYSDYSSGSGSLTLWTNTEVVSWVSGYFFELVYLGGNKWLTFNNNFPGGNPITNQ